jgi:hypothetical protein
MPQNNVLVPADPSDKHCTDFILQNSESCWVATGPFQLYIHQVDGRLTVEAYLHQPDEAADPAQAVDKIEVDAGDYSKTESPLQPEETLQ